MTGLYAALRRADWSRLAEWVVLAGVLAIAALASYTHLRDVWEHTGAPWPALGPLLVDGLFAAAWLRMRRRRQQGQPVGFLAWFTLQLSLAATLAGNVTAAFVGGQQTRDLWLVVAVAAWPAVAFALVWELVTGHDRALGDEQDGAEDGGPVATPDEVVEQAVEEVGLPFASADPVRAVCHVYRLYDAEDALLYVGVGYDVAARARQHKRKKEWWSEVVRGAVTTYPTRRDALLAECDAIAGEKPRYNILPGGAFDHAAPWWSGRNDDWTPSDPIASRENVPAVELHAPVRGEGSEDDQTLADRVVLWAMEEGGMPSRERVRLRFNIGSKRAERIRGLAVELQGSAQSDPGPDSSDSTPRREREEATG